MHFNTKRLLQHLLSIPLDETTFERRGFRQGNSKAVSHLEEIGRTFLQGYRAALIEDEMSELIFSLNRIANEFRGFAFEGAAMALALLDSLIPWSKRRLQALLAIEGADHVYMVHVGAGWAFAKLPWIRLKIGRSLKNFDPLMRPLVIDGLAFNKGFFKPHTYIHAGKKPRHLTGYWLRAFDQGLGRSIWFVEGADVSVIPSTVASFDRSRHGDLWSGVGLACTYAGGVGAEEIKSLKTSAASYLPCLAQGATFAAKARQRAGIVTEHTKLACKIICGMSVEEAAFLADDTLRNLPGDGNAPAYEVWRRRIQAEYSKEVEFA